MTLLLREMELRDSAGIEAIEKAVFSDPWTREGIEETFRQNHAFIAVAEKEEEVVGYCIVYYVLDEAEIARIAVGEEVRNVGTGSGLLAFCERFCVEKGVERMLLDVRESNVTARRFYEKAGFSVDGIRKNFYETPREHAVLMSKMLV